MTEDQAGAELTIATEIVTPDTTQAIVIVATPARRGPLAATQAGIAATTPDQEPLRVLANDTMIATERESAGTTRSTPPADDPRPGRRAEPNPQRQIWRLPLPLPPRTLCLRFWSWQRSLHWPMYVIRVLSTL